MRIRTKSRRSPATFGGLLFFSIFWCALTGVFVGFVLYSIVRHLDAQKRFAETTGVVIDSSVKEHPGDSDSGPTYEPAVHYRYTVNGIEYDARRVAFAKVSSSSYRAAEDTVAQFPPGQSIPVFFDPDRPSESVLQLAIPTEMFFIALFLQPFILIGLGALGYTATFPGRKRKTTHFLSLADTATGPPWTLPTWGELTSDYSGVLTIRKASSPVRRLAMGFAIGYGGTCFLSIFVVGIFFSGFSNPRPVVVAMAFACALVIGLAAAFKSLFYADSSARVFLDQRLGQLRVERTQETLQTYFKDIATWKIRNILNPRQVRSDGDHLMTPMLYAQTKEGREIPVHVFGADDQALPIAQKTGQLLARLSGAEFQPEPEGDTAVFSLDLQDLRATYHKLREATTATQSYRDLT